MIFNKLLSNNFKLLLNNSSWLLCSDIWVYGINFLQGFIIARLIGAKEYGMLAIIVTYVTVVNQLIDFRINEAATKYISQYHADGDKPKIFSCIKLFYAIDLCTGIIAFIIVFVSAKTASLYLLHSKEAAWLIIFYAIKLFFSTIDGTSISIFTVFNKFSWIAILNIFLSIIQFLIILSALLLDYGIKGVLFAYILSSLFRSSISIYMAYKIIIYENLMPYINSKINLLSERRKEIWNFLINTNLYEFFSLFTKNIDILLLGYFRPPSEAGYYKLAKSFVSLFTLLSNPFYQTAYPQFTKLWSLKQIDEFKKIIKQFTYLITALSIPMAIIIFIYIPWIIKFTVGNEFIPSIFIIRLLLWGSLISCILFWTRPAILAIGKAGTATAVSAFCAVTMFLIGIFIIPLYGSTGSAFLYLYFIIILHAVYLNTVNKSLKLFKLIKLKA